MVGAQVGRRPRPPHKHAVRPALAVLGGLHPKVGVSGADAPDKGLDGRPAGDQVVRAAPTPNLVDVDGVVRQQGVHRVGLALERGKARRARERMWV